MYSLVSSGVLALDLARHASGAAVADVVDRVLALTPDDVRALAEEPGTPGRDAARVRVLAVCAQAPRMSRLMRGVGATVATALPAREQSTVMVQALTETMLGSLEDLHALLRREAPLVDSSLPAAGVQAALDAVTVAWAGRAPGVELSELADLRAPWAAALSPVPTSLEASAYGPDWPVLRALLDEISRADDAVWDRVQRSHWEGQGTLQWSYAMHAACRVAHETDRLVAVARAQLAAARAVRLAGVSTGAAASGAMMAVTAAVQATCVQGLLEPSCAQTLMRAWDARRAA